MQETTSSKVKAGKLITESRPKIILKKFFHWPLVLAAQSKVKYKVHRENKFKKIYRRPIIFCVNHTCFQDTPIVCRYIGRQAYILAGKQSLYPIDELFFHLNGSIFVDRKDKEDMTLSKEAMIEYLLRDQSLIVFPEGTWNLSDSLLMLEMKWGIIEVAQRANAQIIPVSLDYNQEDKKCDIKFGEPILAEKFKSKKEAIDYLRDTLATLRWEQIESHGIVKRTDEFVTEAKKQREQTLSDYPLYDEEYEQSLVFKSHENPEQVFAHIKKLEPRKENAFLFNKRLM